MAFIIIFFICYSINLCLHDSLSSAILKLYSKLSKWLIHIRPAYVNRSVVLPRGRVWYFMSRRKFLRPCLKPVREVLPFMFTRLSFQTLADPILRFVYSSVAFGMAC